MLETRKYLYYLHKFKTWTILQYLHVHATEYNDKALAHVTSCQYG